MRWAPIKFKLDFFLSKNYIAHSQNDAHDDPVKTTA